MKQQDTELDGEREREREREHRARIAASFKTERKRIVRYLEYRLRLSRQEAEELAQEACMRLLGLHRRTDVDNWAAFLWRTVQNLANTRLGQLNKFQAVQPLPDDAIEDHRTPEIACVEEQAKAAVLRAIDDLPERLRKVATLIREGHTTAQIALALGISERTCQRYLARAIVAIRRMIGWEETP